MKNPNAYEVPFGSRVKFEIEVALDPVPGAWNRIDDFIRWFCSHNYVQSVEMVDRSWGGVA